MPNINIPIYTIRQGSLEVPISISYHASGIKVSETASWVGLGWTLNAGGAISRSVVGKSDEHGFFQTIVKSASQITESDFSFLKPFADGSGDYESDYYFYNFNGRSGKFLYKQNDHAEPFLIPKEPLSVSKDGESFWIVDESGTKYTFSQKERTEIPGPVVMEEMTSAYYLTSIISADGKDVVTFYYTQDNPYSDNTKTFTETIGQDSPQSGTITNGHHTTNWVTNGRTIYPQRLSEIRFKTGKLTFIADGTRSDILDGTRLAEIQIISKNTDGTYEGGPRKTFVFGEGYFLSSSDSRLKLTSLEEKDSQNGTLKKHKFFYDESMALPRRNSLAQDWWGFYNGQTSNSSLIASQLIGFEGAPYEVGGGSREPNGAAMKVGTLTKIVYPTGGYTEFLYEPHSYRGVKDSTVVVEALSGPPENATAYLEVIKPFMPQVTGWYILKTYCSDITDATNSEYSRVFLRKPGTTPYLVDHYHQPVEGESFAPHLYKDFHVFLQGGVTYEIGAMSKGSSNSTQYDGAAFARGTLSYPIQVENSGLIAGGLRIKEIRDYEMSGAAPITKIYKYGNGDGNGTLLVPKWGVSNGKQEVSIIVYHSSSDGTQTTCGAFGPIKRLLVSGTTALDLTALNGAPVVYEQVTVYENSATAPNGKTVHRFNVQEDEFTYADKAYNNGRWQMNDSWKGGDQLSEKAYLSNTNSIIQTDTSAYALFNSEQIIGTKIGWKTQAEGCTPSYISEEELFLRLYYFDVPFLSGIKKISLTGQKTYSTDDPVKFVETKTTYGYDNLTSNHQQLSLKTTYNSFGEVYETRYWYPADYDGSLDNISSLLANHIIGIPIKEETHKDGNIMSGQVKRLDNYGKPVEVHLYESATVKTASAHTGSVLVPAGYVKRMDISYDPTTQNLTSTQLKDNVKTSYLWGYNNVFPIAQITNGQTSQAFHTSFEDNGVTNAEAKTGLRVWSGLYALNLPAYAGDYELSYWQKTNSDKWRLIQETVTVTGSGQAINIGADGSVIDEVRLVSQGAKMITYTYDALTGMTSSTDVNNVTTYFDYDGFGRLKAVRDFNNNIVKTYSYHYKSN